MAKKKKPPPKIEEISIRVPRFAPPFGFEVFQPLGFFQPTRSPPGPGASDVVDRAFVPPVLPTVIEEIVTTAARRPPTGFGTAAAGAARFNIGSFGAVIFGTLLAKILDDISQRQLDRALEELLAEGRFEPTETPLVTIPAEVIPEIVVVAERPPLVVAPQPIFFDPDADPSIMVPVTPVRAPVTPAPLPDVEVFPEISDPIPTRPPQRLTPTLPFELPAALPFDLPFEFPLTPLQPLEVPSPVGDPLPLADPVPLADPSPLADPLPLADPSPLADPEAFADPRTFMDPRTFSDPRTVPSPFQEPFAQPQPDPVFTGTCPPCEEVEDPPETPRTQCFKKLVKEGITSDLDTEFDWTEIDCRTGREI